MPKVRQRQAAHDKKCAYILAAKNRIGEPHLALKLAADLDCDVSTVNLIAKKLGLQLGKGAPRHNPVIKFTPEQEQSLIEAYVRSPHLSIMELSRRGGAWPSCEGRIASKVLHKAVREGRVVDGEPFQLRDKRKTPTKPKVVFTVPQIRRLAEAYAMEPEKTREQLGAEGDGKWWPKCTTRTVSRVVKKAAAMGMLVDGMPIQFREHGNVRRDDHAQMKYSEETLRACAVEYANPSKPVHEIVDKYGISSAAYLRTMLRRARRRGILAKDSKRIPVNCRVRKAPSAGE